MQMCISAPSLERSRRRMGLHIVAKDKENERLWMSARDRQYE